MDSNKALSNTSSLEDTSKLINNYSFIFLWISSTTSFLALSTYLFAEQWYIIQVLNKEAALGVVMMVTMIPRVFLMIIGGVWADRFKRSKIMFFSSLIRGIFMIALLLFFQFNLLNLWSLLIFALMFGIVDAFFSPANTSLVPTIVSKETLTRANSFIQSSNQIALFSGPLLGGFLLTIGSFQTLFLFIICLLLLTSLFSVLIREVNNPIPNKKQNSTILELKEGFYYVWNMTFLKEMLVILIIINFFFFGPLLMGIPLLVEYVLNGQPLELSALQSSYQGGMLGGAIIIGVLNIKRKRGLTVLSMIIALGGCLMLLGQIADLWQGISLLILMGTLSSIINVTLISTIQEKSQKNKIGRVMSLVNASSNGLVPLSYAFVSLALFVDLSISLIMLICGLLIFIIPTFYMFKSKAIKNLE